MMTFVSGPYTLHIKREDLAAVLAEVRDLSTRDAISGATEVFDPEPVRLGMMQIDALLEAVHEHETKVGAS